MGQPRIIGSGEISLVSYTLKLAGPKGSGRRHLDNPAAYPLHKGMLLRATITAAVVGLSAQAADVQTITARVVGVHDGDTLTALTDDKRELKVRLHGLDAPELRQPFGQASKRALSELVFGKDVTLHVTGNDRYGRTLAHVTVSDIEVDSQMIATGHVWHYRRYDHTAAMEAAERNARAARRGLWAEDNAVATWEWRKTLKGARTIEGK